MDGSLKLDPDRVCLIWFTESWSLAVSMKLDLNRLARWLVQ